tara:strand:+ start:307 stop:531 length:225 start_codon:yes stop_codon:yes gene_type:complete
MYYQVYFQREVSSKVGQVSCDSWEEVQEEVTRLKFPKLVTVEYHNENGLFGTAKKFYNNLKEEYITFSKKQFQK